MESSTSSPRSEKTCSGVWRLRNWSRFSLRFLLVLPVLVALFFTFRQYTIKYGQRDVTRFVEAHPGLQDSNAKYYLPFVLECSTLAWGPNAKSAITNRWYYFWLFGYVCKLPFERQHVDAVTPLRTFSDIADERLLNRGF